MSGSCPLSAHAALCCFPVPHRCPLLWRQFHGSSGSPVVRAGPATPGLRFGLRRPFLVPPRGPAAKSDQCRASLGSPAPPRRSSTSRSRPARRRSLSRAALSLIRPWRLHVFFVYPDTPTAAPSSVCSWALGTERSALPSSHGAMAGRWQGDQGARP